MAEDQAQPQPENTADLQDALEDIRQRLGSLPDQSLRNQQPPAPP